MTNALNTGELLEWSKTATPNSKKTYYVGFSLTDTLLSLEIKKQAWELAVKGQVYLVQKKHCVGEYSFIAIKASHPPNIKLVPLDLKQDKGYNRSKPTNDSVKERVYKWQKEKGKKWQLTPKVAS